MDAAPGVHQRGHVHLHHRQRGQLRHHHHRLPDGDDHREPAHCPAALTFTNKGDGTGTIAGTPAAATGGAYSVTLTAANGISTTSKSLAITVNQAPAITSKSSANGSTFHAFSFPITATGYPKPTITESGGLPLGVKFSGGANGSATISGTPILPGTYKVTLTAKSTAGTATQGLTITIAFALNSSTPAGAAGQPTTGSTSTSGPPFARRPTTGSTGRTGSTDDRQDRRHRDQGSIGPARPGGKPTSMPFGPPLALPPSHYAWRYLEFIC